MGTADGSRPPNLTEVDAGMHEAAAALGNASLAIIESWERMSDVEFAEELTTPGGGVLAALSGMLEAIGRQRAVVERLQQHAIERADRIIRAEN